MYSQNAASASKPLIQASKVHRTNAKLAESGGTHDTWLNCDVQNRFFEYAWWVFLQDLRDGNELRMPGTLGYYQREKSSRSKIM